MAAASERTPALATLQVAADDHLAASVNAVKLEN